MSPTNTPDFILAVIFVPKAEIHPERSSIYICNEHARACMHIVYIYRFYKYSFLNLDISLALKLKYIFGKGSLNQEKVWKDRGL